MGNDSLDTLLYGMQFRRLLEREMEPLQREYGLNKVDMLILIFLSRSGERNTSTDIMQMRMFTRGHISQSLSCLQRKGYIVMEQDSADHRCMHNRLTADAERIAAHLEQAYRRMKAALLDGVTEEELQTFLAVVKKMDRNISRVIVD